MFDCTSSDMLIVEEGAICLQYSKAVCDATYVGCIMCYGDQMSLFSRDYIYKLFTIVIFAS
jgi:hypothetical protein